MMASATPASRRLGLRQIVEASTEGFTPSRYFDPNFQRTAVRVQPGTHYISNDSREMLVTVLGSCVSACIRDPILGFGGMNHFMLPKDNNGQWGVANSAMRYGSFAMEILINDLLKLGCQRSRLEVKLFGGAKVGNLSSTVGQQNAEFAVNYLKSEGFTCAAKDLGGPRGRRIHYFPESGKVKRLILRRSTDLGAIEQDEATYERSIADTGRGGDIELFD